MAQKEKTEVEISSEENVRTKSPKQEKQSDNFGRQQSRTLAQVVQAGKMRAHSW